MQRMTQLNQVCKMYRNGYMTDDGGESSVISVKPSFIDGKVQALVIA